MKKRIRKHLKKLAEEVPDTPTELDPDLGIITVELNGEHWKEGTVREIADQFNIDLSKFNSLTKEAFKSTLQGLSGGKIEIKEGRKH